MMTDKQLKIRDAGRDIGVELLHSVREMTAGRWARKTTFEPLSSASIRRTVVRAGTLEKQGSAGEAAQSLLKLISRYPELLAELASCLASA